MAISRMAAIWVMKNSKWWNFTKLSETVLRDPKKVRSTIKTLRMSYKYRMSSKSEHKATCLFCCFDVVIFCFLFLFSIQKSCWLDWAVSSFSKTCVRSFWNFFVSLDNSCWQFCVVFLQLKLRKQKQLVHFVVFEKSGMRKSNFWSPKILATLVLNQLDLVESPQQSGNS